jgi:LETM1 and EF-hand domain-containing protein 1, mitochondrial
MNSIGKVLPSAGAAFALSRHFYSSRVYPLCYLNLQRFTYSTNGSASKPAESPPKLPLSERMKTWPDAIKKELKHYMVGSKLYFSETMDTCRILGKYILRKPILRREQLQVVRTVKDTIKLVPFSVFVIVPFLELLLPLFVKLFPNSLPSTFEKSSDRLARQTMAENRQLKAAEGFKGGASIGAYHPKLEDLFKAYHLSGQSISTTDFVDVAESVPPMAIEDLTHTQLVLLNSYLGLGTYGPTVMLRTQLRYRLSTLKKDDELIENEGIDNLSDEELYVACHARGIKVLNLPKETVQSDLQQWIDLHLHRKIDPLLLVISRALIMNARKKIASEQPPSASH